jgi:Fur family transcriptional regulator, ferric uptake regulator
MINKAQFKTKGIKHTPRRQKVLDVLSDTEYLLSVDEIYQILVKDDPNISISTVYRTLETFRQAGFVETNQLPGESVLYYEIRHDDHAHHLICSRCHKVVHLDECPLDDYEETVAKSHAFVIQHHQLDLYGLCQSCQQA